MGFDLGVQCSYTGRRSIAEQSKRLKALDPLRPKLRRIDFAEDQKHHALRQCLRARYATAFQCAFLAVLTRRSCAQAARSLGHMDRPDCPPCCGLHSRAHCAPTLCTTRSLTDFKQMLIRQEALLSIFSLRWRVDTPPMLTAHFDITFNLKEAPMELLESLLEDGCDPIGGAV